MYTIPEGQVTFADIETFCLEEHEEDLILDYKVDWPNDLGRILCGMANVQGGMVLIGIGTQKGTRKPAWPAPGVIGTDDGLRQRVIQIAYDNIYPPVLPQIDVVRFPTDLEKAIVVIRVDASRLLHATEQRRKVYIRVADHSRGIENELANLSQLEWLFQQRQKSVELREEVIERASERVLKFNSTIPKIKFWAIPVFPQANWIKTPPELLEVVNNIGSPKSRTPQMRVYIPMAPTHWRTTAEGVFTWTEVGEELKQYFEVSSQGLIYLEHIIQTYSEVDPYSNKDLSLLSTATVLSNCDAFLIFAINFYEKIKWSGPLLLHAELEGTSGFTLDHRLPQNNGPYFGQTLGHPLRMR